MALSDADKAEMTDLFAGAFAKGLALYRSAVEEEEARAGASGDGKKDENTGGSKSDTDSSGFSLPGFILGSTGR